MKNLYLGWHEEELSWTGKFMVTKPKCVPSWNCRKGFGETLEPFPVPKEAARELEKDFYKGIEEQEKREWLHTAREKVLIEY